MNYTVVLRSAAEGDIEEAYGWYERKQTGRGIEFIRSVEATTDKLTVLPDFGIPVHKRANRILLRAQVGRFPYGVFYIVDASKIVVIGVIHNRRAPRIWKGRLK